MRECAKVREQPMPRADASLSRHEALLALLVSHALSPDLINERAREIERASR